MTGLRLDPLSPIESRIARGLQHVDELEEEVGRYKRTGRRGPYQIDHIPDGDDWFVGRVRVTRDPSPSLGVIAGECVFQFSHALDNLVTAMVRLKDPSPRRHWPSWPYLTDRDKWTEKVEQQWRGMLTPEHYGIVFREQPFNRDPDARFDEWTVRDLVVWLRDRWCLMVECDSPRRWAAAFSEPVSRTAATTSTSRSVARAAGRDRRVKR